MAQTKVRKSIFWRLFAVGLVLLIIGAAALLYYGNKVMQDYDKSQRFPYENVQELAAQIERGDYSLIFDRDNLPNSMTIERKEYERRIAEAVKENGGCDVKRGFSAESIDNPTFIISAGKKKIATVVYTKSKDKSEYGFDCYKFLSLTPFYEGSYAVKALVPEFCDFILDDQLMPEKYRTGETAVSERDVDDFENSGGEDTSYFYYVDGLMEQPTFSIVYKDTKRPADLGWSEEIGAWIVKTYDVSAEAPSNFTVFVNGKQVSGDPRYTTKENIEIPEIAAGLKYTEKKVTMRTFHVSGLRYADEISVTMKDFEGSDVEPAYSEEKNLYSASAGITPKDIGAYGIDDEFLLLRGINYARFVNNDGKFWDIMKKFLLPGSQAYTDFESFWVTFTPHNSYWLENKSVDEVTFYHENLFYATVSFDYWIKGFNHQTDNIKVYPTSISFWYTKDSNGNWMIVDWMLNS